jgi:tetratricopeptide (TPR) repeat protein
VFSLVAGLLLPLGLAGCQSGGGSDLNAAIDAYESARYDEGYDTAGTLMRRSQGAAHGEAAYLAGLCAYRLGRSVDAEVALQEAVQSGQGVTAAQARAMLGIIRMEQGRNLEAARMLEQAAPGLETADRRQAMRQAASAYRLAGDLTTAQALSDGSSDIASSITREPARSAGGFTLQAGAFWEPQRARSAAGELNQLARQHGLSGPQVVNGRDETGRPLYLVRLGRFDSRHEAASVRRQMGRLEFIVTAAGSG